MAAHRKLKVSNIRERGPFSPPQRRLCSGITTIFEATNTYCSFLEDGHRPVSVFCFRLLISRPHLMEQQIRRNLTTRCESHRADLGDPARKPEVGVGLPVSTDEPGGTEQIFQRK
jgi:hypothetical protein